MASLMQPLVAQILGFDPETQPEAFRAVRVSWQQQGQPGPRISENVCILRATLQNAPYSRVRDGLFRSAVPENSTAQLPGAGEAHAGEQYAGFRADLFVGLSSQMSFTQVWNLHLTLYGPNCADRARLISSAMALDWAREALAASNLYAIPDWHRPVYAPELFQGQWWPRADLDLEFNELVNESITVPSAAGVDITLIKETGLTAEIHIRAAE